MESLIRLSADTSGVSVAVHATLIEKDMERIRQIVREEVRAALDVRTVMHGSERTPRKRLSFDISSSYPRLLWLRARNPHNESIDTRPFPVLVLREDERRDWIAIDLAEREKPPAIWMKAHWEEVQHG